jgi:NAD(P)-dependent dehydrogenase (short-subunit alcohol dehydrogenase family)
LVVSTVVITGANRGLGLELARAFAAHGDAVIAGCRNPAGASELDAVTDQVHAVDMGDRQSIDAFVSAIGDQTVDVLVNNAGLDARNLGADDSERDVLVQSPDHIVGQFEVNAVGPLLLARGLLPQLRRAATPRIVNVSSQVGSMEVGRNMGRDVGYSVSKSALNMVTVKLAARLHDEGIVVIALHPGYLRTSMGGAAAAMDPDDAARQIVTLVDGLSIADSGSFRRWDGTIHPW